MSPNELPPDAVLGRPTRRGSDAWTLEATCYACGQRLGVVVYVTEEDGHSYYVETELAPELVERRGADPETGWPRFAVTGRPAGRKAAAEVPVAAISAGPVILSCPRATCGKRQAIVPELQWTPTAEGSTATAGSVAWGGSKLAAWYDAQRKANAAIREKRPRARAQKADAAGQAERMRNRRLRRREDLLRQRDKLIAEIEIDPDGSGAYPAARIQLHLVEQWIDELEADLGTVDAD
jgi:hypothetical protein